MQIGINPQKENACAHGHPLFDAGIHAAIPARLIRRYTTLCCKSNMKFHVRVPLPANLYFNPAGDS
jgi:hypothetical protein